MLTRFKLPGKTVAVYHFKERACYSLRQLGLSESQPRFE